MARTRTTNAEECHHARPLKYQPRKGAPHMNTLYRHRQHFHLVVLMIHLSIRSWVIMHDILPTIMVVRVGRSISGLFLATANEIRVSRTKLFVDLWLAGLVYVERRTRPHSSNATHHISPRWYGLRTQLASQQCFSA